MLSEPIKETLQKQAGKKPDEGGRNEGGRIHYPIEKPAIHISLVMSFEGSRSGRGIVKIKKNGKREKESLGGRGFKNDEGIA